MFSRTIAAFDFDGTLTTKDTLLEFIRFACGRTRFYAGFLLFAPLIVLMKMGLISNGRVKEKLFSWFFKGMSYADFSEKGREFARLIAGFERKETKEKLQTHLAEGHDVYVVTASIEEWVRPYCMQLGVKDVLGTKVEVADGVLTGRFASPNCYGKEKANRLLEAVPDLGSCTLYAYGDSRGDREMLQMSCNQQDQSVAEGNTKQLQWVNIVKGITMIAVVLLHINYTGYSTDHYSAIRNILGDAWDMPVFFLVGGFFLSQQKLTATRTFLKRKFKSIYVKLLLYYLLFLCLHNILINAGFLSTEMEYGGKYMTLFTLTDFAEKALQALFFMGREPYLSPLWFVYVMFMAFIVIALLANITDRLTKGNSRQWHIVMTVTLAVLCQVALFFTNSLDINIPRCNNVFSAAWLIFLGYLVRNKLSHTWPSRNKLSLSVRFSCFSSSILSSLSAALPSLRQFAAALLSILLLTSVCFFSRHMALITNSYANILQLTVCGLTALYLLYLLAVRMEHTVVGRCLAHIGSRSYHIMALHLLVINIAAALLGCPYPIDTLGTEATTLAELAMFTAIGVALPSLLPSRFLLRQVWLLFKQPSSRFRPFLVRTFFLSLPVILFLLIQILPTFDDWTYITAPYFGDFFSPERLLPWNGYWRPFDALIGSILGLNPHLFPALNHSLILLAHAVSTCLVYRLSGKKILPAAFFFLSPAMLGTVLDIDSVNQAYATCWGLLSLLFYQRGKKWQWILCVMIATFCKENGIMYTFIPFLFKWLQNGLGGGRWGGGSVWLVLAFLTLYGAARILLTSPENQIQDAYLTATPLDHLKDVVQYVLFTWLPMDYEAAVFPPTRFLPLAALTFLLPLPFLLLLAKGLWSARRDRTLWALIAAYFLAAAPHLLTLVSMMHIYAGLPFAALIVGRLQSRHFRVLPIILFFAASLVTDAHHYHAAYESGLMGKDMAEQVLSQTKTKSERVFVVTIDRGEQKYSIFNVIPSDAFGWGLAARHYSGYTVASELRDTTIAAPATPAEKQQTVKRIAEEVRPHYPYDALWVVDGKEVTVINPPVVKP